MPNDASADHLLNTLLADTSFSREAAPAAENESLASLLSGLVADAQQLARREFDLARQEVLAEVDKVKQGAVALGVGGGVLLLGGLLLTLMLVYSLSALFRLPLWASYLIVGVAALIAGFVLLRRGLSKLKQIDFVPDQTIETLKEDAAWTRN